MGGFIFTGGVDTVDKMISCYSCQRKTNRWPMTVFFNIIDISALNAYIIFKEMNRNWHMRRNFLHELGVSLAKPYMNSQIAVPQSELESSSSLLMPMGQAGQDPMISSDSSPSASSSRDTSPNPPPQKRSKCVPPQLEGRARCHICFADGKMNKNNMHRSICCFCRKGCCKHIHNRNVCTKCFAKKLI